MINYTQIEDSLRTIVQPILGCETIIAKPSAPRPLVRPYATIELMDTRQRGFGEASQPTNTGIANVWAHEELTVQFTAFGVGSKNVMKSLQFSFNKESVIDALLVQGLALVTHDDTLDIPVIRDTIWEEASRLTATFHVRITGTDDVGFINEVTVVGEMEGEVYLPSADTTITISIP